MLACVCGSSEVDLVVCVCVCVLLDCPLLQHALSAGCQSLRATGDLSDLNAAVQRGAEVPPHSAHHHCLHNKSD